MRQLTATMRSGWHRAGTVGRLWWSALAAVVVAVALVAVVSVSADLSSQPQPAAATLPASSSDAPPAHPGTGRVGAGASTPPAMAPTMAGMAAGAPTAGSGSGGVTTSNSVCPNVNGADVMSNGMVMAPVPSGPPTAGQQAAANGLVAAVAADIPKYATPAVAESDGFTPATNPNGRYVHYLNVATVRAGDVLDPEHPSALMFANTVRGPVLLGAMFLGPAPCQPGPDVGGPLTDWHAHDDLCLSGGEVVGTTDATGTCAAGVHNPSTYFMLHVWTAPSIASKYQFQADIPRSALVPIIRTGQA